MGWPYQQKPPMGWPLDYDSGLANFVGAWFFLESSGGQVNDLSGNGNTGIFQDTVLWKPGKFGQALDCGVAAGYVQVSDSPTLDFGTNPFSISIWFNCTSKTVHRGIIGKNNYTGTSPANEYLWGLYIQTGTGNLIFAIDGDCEGLVSAVDYADSLWHHVVIVREPDDSGSMYVDGILVDTDPDHFSGLSINNDQPLWIGAVDVVSTRAFSGLLDLPMIWKNHAFTAGEVALLYRYPFWMFKDPDELALLGGYQVVVGAAGIMTTNTGYWGPTF